jgi:hypothetical protein
MLALLGEKDCPNSSGTFGIGSEQYCSVEKSQSSTRRGGRFPLRGMKRGNLEQLCFAKAARIGADAFAETLAPVGVTQPHVEQPQATKLKFSSQTRSLAINTSGIRRVHYSAECTPPYIVMYSLIRAPIGSGCRGYPIPLTHLDSCFGRRACAAGVLTH